MPTVRKVVPGKFQAPPKVTRVVPKTSPPESTSTIKTKPEADSAPLPEQPPEGRMEYETSESIDKLAAAFVGFRAACPNMEKDRKGYNYRYTTLGHIIEASRDHLKKAGLAVMQFPIASPGYLGVITVLMHASGQFIRARFMMPIPGLSGTNVTQNAGAAITYARRYALSAVLCVAADEDTDGT